MMGDSFAIGKVLIPYKDIRNYGIVRREYIYRPGFTEKPDGLTKSLSVIKYDFVAMVPYAAVITKEEYDSLRASKIERRMEARERAAHPLSSALADGINTISSFTAGSQTFYCINQAGRSFKTTLSSIPPVVLRDGAQITELHGPAAKVSIPKGYNPTIYTVSSLYINTAKQQYMFYGNGIDIVSPENDLQRLEEDLSYLKDIQLDERKPSAGITGKLRSLFSKGSQSF